MFTFVNILHRLNPLLSTNLGFFSQSFPHFYWLLLHFGQSVPERSRSRL